MEKVAGSTNFATIAPDREEQHQASTWQFPTRQGSGQRSTPAALATLAALQGPGGLPSQGLLASARAEPSTPEVDGARIPAAARRWRGGEPKPQADGRKAHHGDQPSDLTRNGECGHHRQRDHTADPDLHLLAAAGAFRTAASETTLLVFLSAATRTRIISSYTHGIKVSQVPEGSSELPVRPGLVLRQAETSSSSFSTAPILCKAPDRLSL